MNEQTDILLARYFNGEATEQELQQLDHWLAQSEEHEAYFHRMSMLFQETAPVAPMAPPGLEQALSQFKAYMEESKLQSRDAVAGKKPIRLRPVFRIAAAAIALLLVGISLFLLLRNPVEPPVQMFVTTNTPEQHTLFEHVDVLLDAESRIEINPCIKHEVSLTGKATFTVASKPQEGLIVCAGETFVKDIGTIFTVIAPAPDAPITVEVGEGEVLFYTREDAGIHIMANEKGIYDPHARRFEHVRQIIEPLEDLLFQNISLGEVIHILESRYNVSIVAEPASLKGRMHISASFDKDESLDNILSIIAETLSVNISKNGDSYIISQ